MIWISQIFGKGFDFRYIAESITAVFKVADDDILIFFGLPKYQLCWYPHKIRG
jgi:hypothetical protein